MKSFLPYLLTAACLVAFTNFKPTNSTVSESCLIAPPPLDCANPASNVEKIVCLTNTFKALLTSTQITSLEIALTTTTQAKWTNLPGGVSNRNGLEFSTLTAAQIAAANDIIKAAAGTATDDGSAEFSQIRAADAYLGTQGGGNGYSDGKYIIAFLGAPSLTGKWMLQFGGHHYAQNITFNGGKVIGTTPSHQGVEPLSFTNTSGTFTPLKNEHAGMLALLSGLTTTQLASAIITTRFSDVALGPGKDGQFPATKAGLSCATLTAAQKALVFAAMKSWTNDADNASGAALQVVYENEIDQTYITYSGNATLATNADYVRIDGPSVWMELVCQSGVVLSGIHYHAIYRDHTRDYGASGALTGVKEVFGDVTDTQFKTNPIFPNPLSISTNIPLTLNFTSKVKVSIFDLAGKAMGDAINTNMTEGEHNLVLNRNLNGNPLSAGMYVCKILVENKNGSFGQSKLFVVQ
jgi:Protein of unknown function (DUF3500)/Secretion system C-terminal sorting domain